jgi:hypothetical protein
MALAAEGSISGKAHYFRLRQFLRASPSSKPEVFLSLKLLAWFYALMHSVCDREVQRILHLGSDIENPLEFGRCWREAFGDPIDVVLQSTGTSGETSVKFESNESTENSGILPHVRTLTTIPDLRSALNIDSEAILSGTTLIRRAGGICVLVGHIPGCNLPLWHVCSIEEVCLINADPDSFLCAVQSTRDHILRTGIPQNMVDWNVGQFPEDAILIGALIQPDRSRTIRCHGLFQAAEPAVAGRTNLQLQTPGLRWIKCLVRFNSAWEHRDLRGLYY